MTPMPPPPLNSQSLTVFNWTSRTMGFQCSIVHLQYSNFNVGHCKIQLVVILHHSLAQYVRQLGDLFLPWIIERLRSSYWKYCTFLADCCQCKQTGKFFTFFCQVSLLFASLHSLWFITTLPTSILINGCYRR